jgi:hypothetical protein
VLYFLVGRWLPEKEIQAVQVNGIMAGEANIIAVALSALSAMLNQGNFKIL